MIPVVNGETKDSPKEKTFLAPIKGFLPLYTVLLFLPGAIYLGFYYRGFGIVSLWFELPFADVLVRSFVLVVDRPILLALYAGVLVVPVLIELVVPERNLFVANCILAALLGCTLVLGVWESQGAAVADSDRDKGNETTLPLITYRSKSCVSAALSTASRKPTERGKGDQDSVNSCTNVGRLLAIRDSAYFILVPGQPEAATTDLRVLPIAEADEVFVSTKPPQQKGK